ncbi:MAG TPA: uracil-DNA glycosylase [Desulfotomaculum sp.]|nr:uracil-DNA glycosylase [Desulfotomaculum sp.]
MKEKDHFSSTEKPNCFNCIHFYITWEKTTPNGCRLYGIKTKHNPSKVVLSSTGTGCLGYEEKIRNKS